MSKRIKYTPEEKYKILMAYEDGMESKTWRLYSKELKEQIVIDYLYKTNLC